jgi:hypothetical protein
MVKQMLLFSHEAQEKTSPSAAVTGDTRLQASNSVSLSLNFHLTWDSCMKLKVERLNTR